MRSRGLHLILLAALIPQFSGCGGGGGGGGGGEAFQPDGNIPALAVWEDHMRTFGQANCDALQGGGSESRLAGTYYDAEWVYYQISEYTGDRAWLGCAQIAESVYRDEYVMRNQGNVPGYWNFPQGLAEDYRDTGDARSKDAVLLLSDNAAFASPSTPANATASVLLSRETAYTIIVYLSAQSLGSAENPRLALLVNQAFGHLDQWFDSRTAPYLKPFMVGLTAQALIMWHDASGDPRVMSALSTAADQLWQRTWVQQSRAFKYIDRHVPGEGGPDPAPDLNLLIAPMYAWLYHQTGHAKYREEADQIFAGGVENAFLGNPKQFNQNYRWSFDYVRWRTETPLR